MFEPALAALAYLLTLAGIVVWLPVLTLLLALTWPFDRNRRIAGRFFRFCGVFVARTFPLWRVRIEGKWPREKQAYVVVANHQSMLDILLLSRLPREMKWVAKESLFKIPWVGWMMRLAGDIPIRRGDPLSAHQALERARDYLKRGMSVMIFPEGTRSRDGHLLPFKTGAFRLAIETGAPVLPVAVSGTGEGMPAGGPWIRPARATARILPPVDVAGLGEGDVERLAELVRARIGSALNGLSSSKAPVPESA